MKDNGEKLKSSFELAIERMAQRGEGMTSLTAKQKEAMADISRRTQAKIAEVEILFAKTIAQARAANDIAKADTTELELRREIARLREREETDRDRIRKG